MRFAVDTGGTFTDLIVESDVGELSMFKAPTTPDDPIRGVLNSLDVAAEALGRSRASMLGSCSLFIHGTTHAINAIVTGATARTALITNEGHRDILVLREGGRMEPFNHTVAYPDPYIPRSLTFEVPGRILADGSEFEELDEAAMGEVAARLEALGVESVAVCLLWSIVNPAHELKIEEILHERLPGVPITLSHRLNPSLREYRRASSAAIDASLKPMMQAYIGMLEARLREAGFAGRLLIVTSQGGVMDASDIAEAPIHIVNSGPSMAPVAGRAYAALDEASDTAIIADTGGTTFDVSLVSGGRIPRTRETWIGQPFRGHMTGFPSVDVKSIGAGGGSIAWVDGGGLLHVGPLSAGADPGPACYAQGGTRPTVSDAALVLGYLDPRFFLGGRIALDADAAVEAISREVGEPLGLAAEDAAAAIVNVATENMVQAIADITVNQGIDPASAILIGGGGAAGLNSVQIARRLGCSGLLIPEVGAGLSAAGAMMSDLMTQFRRSHFASTAAFDFDGVNAVLEELEVECQAFADGPGAGSLDQSVELMAEARYPDQVWEIEVALPVRRFSGPSDVVDLVEAFHRAHEEIFAIRDARAGIEVMAWVATVRCRLRDTGDPASACEPVAQPHDLQRSVHFLGHGRTEARVLRLEQMPVGETVRGPAIVESPFTAIVVDPGATAVRRPSGSLSLTPGSASHMEGSG